MSVLTVNEKIYQQTFNQMHRDQIPNQINAMHIHETSFEQLDYGKL